jgi:hypothetical protein
LVVALAALLAVPVVAVAADRFNDVPSTNIFHDDIAWLADAGVTAGCNPPANDEFCPEDAVKRQQMAAFMRRFAQYLGAEDGIVSEADYAAMAGDADMLDGLDSSAFVAAGTTVDGTFACAGTAHVPFNDTTTYDWVGSLLYRTGGSDLFRCSAHLPDGAIVTSVDWSVLDETASDVSCAMWRTNMVTGIGSETNMAAASSTGTPGEVQITDSSVASATIDNANHAYFTQCSLNGTASDMGLYGVTIAYTDNPNATTADATGGPQGQTGSSTD